MDSEQIKAPVNRYNGMSYTWRMEVFTTPGTHTCKATMKVDGRNTPPFGFLSGGASLALAENLAGVGSLALCPGKICVGIQVSGNHVRAVHEGDTVTAHARLQYQGNTLHEWHIDIVNTNDELISTVHVTNYIMKTSAPRK